MAATAAAARTRPWRSRLGRTYPRVVAASGVPSRAAVARSAPGRTFMSYCPEPWVSEVRRTVPPATA
jgi:hypothetical protein